MNEDLLSKGSFGFSGKTGTNKNGFKSTLGRQGEERERKRDVSIKCDVAGNKRNFIFDVLSQ
jgi:hypothetical protein